MIKKKLTLTIVIPAYNEERYLKSCLDSIAAQTVPPDEVIVVDNNSTDQTAKIARSYPFVKLIKENQQGVTFARSRGFNVAKSQIIGRIDADTVLPTDWAEHVLNFYVNQSNRTKAWTGYAYYYDVRFSSLFAFIYRLLGFKINRLIIGHDILWGSNMAITSKQWKSVAGTACKRTDIHEDLDLALHLAKNGYEIFLDKSEVVGASLQIASSGRRHLWRQLMLWPTSLRNHGYKSWVLVWFFAGLCLFALSPLFIILARPRPRKPAFV